MNIEYFCVISGLAQSDRQLLIKKFKTEEKTYGEWFELISKNFTIPKNVSNIFEKNQSKIKNEKNIRKNGKIKSKKSNK